MRSIVDVSLFVAWWFAAIGAFRSSKKRITYIFRITNTSNYMLLSTFIKIVSKTCFHFYPLKVKKTRRFINNEKYRLAPREHWKTKAYWRLELFSTGLLPFLLLIIIFFAVQFLPWTLHWPQLINVEKYLLLNFLESEIGPEPWSSVKRPWTVFEHQIFLFPSGLH